MPSQLQINGSLNDAGQLVTDGNGAASVLALSKGAVGIGTTTPGAMLGVAGDVHIEHTGSPKLTLYSRGNGTRRYSIRVTNDSDPAGGACFIIRNEDSARDELVLDPAGNVSMLGDLKLERTGSPKLHLRSRGNGTRHYSIRATNDSDPAGGACFIIRNEDAGRDELVLDPAGNLSIRGDVLLKGADCAERFAVASGADVEPGSVLVIGVDDELRVCTEPYDRRVAGVISGAGDCRAGIILGADEALPGNRLPVALAGKVYCRVDAEPAAIEMGDLLTTSAVPGHAMKALEERRAFGAIVGKAMRPLARGRGLIPILVALQ